MRTFPLQRICSMISKHLTRYQQHSCTKGRRNLSIPKNRPYYNRRGLRCTDFCRAWQATGPAEKCGNQPWWRDMAAKYGVMDGFAQKPNNWTYQSLQVKSWFYKRLQLKAISGSESYWPYKGAHLLDVRSALTCPRAIAIITAAAKPTLVCILAFPRM